MKTASIETLDALWEEVYDAFMEDLFDGEA